MSAHNTAGGIVPDRFSLRRLRIACRDCSVRDLCLPLGLDREQLDDLEKVAEHLGPLEPAARLFRLGQTLSHIYAVRSGTFKTRTFDDHGREHILGFHLPGELMGLDGIYPGQHQCEAVSLETTTVCRFEYQHLEALTAQLPALQRQMFRLMSKDLQGHPGQESTMGSDERVSAFLLDWSARQKKLGHSPTHFVLSMSRRDLANYLGLAPETVSRTIRKFMDSGLIALNGHEIEILDVEGLKAV